MFLSQQSAAVTERTLFERECPVEGPKIEIELCQGTSQVGRHERLVGKLAVNRGDGSAQNRRIDQFSGCVRGIHPTPLVSKGIKRFTAILFGYPGFFQGGFKAAENVFGQLKTGCGRIDLRSISD